jgi:organic radical activating enzyme
MAKNIRFPIKTETACLLKWNWSTIRLTTGTTQSCHRNQPIPFALENFQNFHNLPEKIKQREDMLAGKWPTRPFELYNSHDNCDYCKKIEEAGGTSDRMYQNATMTDQTPDELVVDQTATHVSPAVLEIYIDNRCNLACNYCSSNNSSRIEKELIKHRDNKVNLDFYSAPSLALNDGFYRFLPPDEKEKYFQAFLDYMSSEKGKRLRRLNILGGEPFYQPEFLKILEHIKLDRYPNLVICVVTNAMVGFNVFKRQLALLNELKNNGHIDRVDITISVDCWGAGQEYVRWGFKRDLFEKNVLYALSQDVTVHINSVHSIMSFDDYLALVHKKCEWEKTSGQNIALFGQLVGGCVHMESEMLGGEFWYDTFKNIKSNFPINHENDENAYNNILGSINYIEQQNPNIENIKHFLTYFNEIDIRRKTDWKSTFPRICSEIKKHFPNLTTD